MRAVDGDGEAWPIVDFSGVQWWLRDWRRRRGRGGNSKGSVMAKGIPGWTSMMHA